jgi:hypothetical protein
MQSCHGRVESISSEWLASARAAGAAGTGSDHPAHDAPATPRAAPPPRRMHGMHRLAGASVRPARAATHTLAGDDAHSRLPDAALTVADLSERALSSAARLGAGLIAATVSAGHRSAPDAAVSVRTPAMPARGAVTSSEENSPQLVDVLRQSALHERYLDSVDVWGEARGSERSLADGAEDDMELDDEWVTVDARVSDCGFDGAPGNLAAARGFLQRHVWTRLRPHQRG